MFTLQSLFYVAGTVFFIIVIVACILFIRRTSQTSKQIKKVLNSAELDSMIQQLATSIRRIGI